MWTTGVKLIRAHTDATAVADSEHYRTQLDNQGTTNYSISLGAQNMSGEIGSEYGYAHMYKHLLNCFPNPYPLASENHYTSEHGAGTADETVFHDWRFVMGSNLESSMANKLPTLSGNEMCKDGNTLILKVTRTGTDDRTLLALVEFTQILKIDNRGQLTLLN